MSAGFTQQLPFPVVMSGNNDPHPYLRAFWGIMMGAIAIALISLGEGGVSALQSFIVITAVPVSLILLPTLWTAPRYARQMLEEQQLKQS